MDGSDAEPEGWLEVQPRARAEAPLEGLTVSAYRVPTDFPESDGTLEWDATTLVLVEAQAGGHTGLGWSYTDVSAARLVESVLAEAVEGRDSLAVPAAWAAMLQAVRNLGVPGVAATAISAVDAALWDLKGRLLDLPLVTLLGAARAGVPVYGSGGFTSYPPDRLQAQLAGWVASGISRVKMKVGREPERDPARVRAARQAIGEEAALFVDANGAYSRKQALALADAFAGLGVSWLEEPVPSDDLAGLRLVRDRVPSGMEVAAGEYGYEPGYFRRMLEAGAVDVLQVDASRCLGITGFLKAAALCEAFGLPLSTHCAPSLHAQVACAAGAVRHVEWFHDHVRIERLFFDGALEPVGGELVPDPSRPGLGLDLKRPDVERYAI